ncbi:MAG: alpha/beta hydrolase-fold protein [Chloroflexota bacterium]
MNSFLPATLLGTEVRKLTSNYVDQEYRISIALPYSYADKDAAERNYPTIYLLDADWYFGTISEITRITASGGSLPETIVIGIGYPVAGTLKESVTEHLGLRTRDYTDVANTAVTNTDVPDKTEDGGQKREKSSATIASGGAGQFRQFIQKELMPFVASEYRTDSANQILVGHSLGGLFALYTLFHEPSLFQGVVAASPSLWHGDHAIFATENAYAQKASDLPAKLYLSVGQKEEGPKTRMVSNLFRFSALLKSREYNQLTVKNQFFDDLDHREATMPGFQFGLTWIFS